jgi:hypothetical protein
MKRLEIGALVLAFAIGVAAVAGCSSGGVPAAPVGATVPGGAATPTPSPIPTASPSPAASASPAASPSPSSAPTAVPTL